MKRLNALAGFAWVLAITVGLSTAAVAGDSVLFKGSFEGALTQRVPHPAPPVFLDQIESTGTATHLGRFELVELAEVDFGIVPPQAQGVALLVAANGDTLTAVFTGSSVSVGPGLVLITEDAIITGGTGRFSGASGSFTIQRLFDRVTLETIGSFEGTMSR